jgi:tetratricopeptide (TPR) repeat protein
MADNPRIDELKRRVQRDPTSIAFAALADEYRRAGLFHDAIETCRAGLLRHPAYLSARVTLGRALLEIGEYQEATQHLEEVLRSAPENLAAIRALADIHHRRGERFDAPPEPAPQAVPEPTPPAPRPTAAPLKLVAAAADRGISARPATVAPAPVSASGSVLATGGPVQSRTPPRHSLILEDLELFLGGIGRARQSLGA